MAKRKKKWTCIYYGPYTMDTYGREYQHNRLFIKNGDHSRVFVCDNSGDNPDEAEGGPIEIDLTKSAWLSVYVPYNGNPDDQYPSYVNVHTVCECHTTISFEAMLLLNERYRMSVKSKLSKKKHKELLDIGRVLQLTEPALKQLAREAP